MKSGVLIERKGIVMERRDRVYCLVDLENACGGSGLVGANWRGVFEAIGRISPLSPPQIVYSTGPTALQLNPSLLWQCQPARFVLGKGLDGADKALIDVLKTEPVAMRSARVILVSGDHAFAESMGELTSKGIRTTVVSRPGSLAKSLQSVADDVYWLDEIEISDTQSIDDVAHLNRRITK